MTEAEVSAVLLSLKVSAVAVTWTLPVAFGLAWLLARGRFAGRFALNILVHLPLVLPPVVIGYLLLLTFGQAAPLGRALHEVLGVGFVFSWTGAALAAGIVTLPFQVRAIRLALEVIDPQLESVARTLGATPLDVLRTVTLPLAAPGIVAGLITAFAASLGEFGAIITFVSNVPGETQTLPLAIYSALQSPGGEAMAARLSLLAIVLAVIGLALSEWTAQRLKRWSA
ncbi:MAG: molybdate ABC transporter permease subunit [Gammaproteobacteria bacterium]